MVGPIRLAATALAALLTCAAVSAKVPPPGTVSGAFVLPDRPLWAGEVFDLAFAWRVDWAAFGHLEGDPAWDPAPLIAEPWAPPALAPPAPAEATATIRFTTRALAPEAGAIMLRPVRQTMVVRTGTLRTADYERAITEPVEAIGAAGRLTVRARPPAPPGFSGAVGRFRLTSVIGKGPLVVGKAMNWTLTLEGVGNWPALHGLPPRQLSRDFDLLGEPRVQEEPGKSLFERRTSEMLTIIPRRPGPHVLGPVEMPVFDPAQGRYVLIRAPEIRVNVRPSPGQLQPTPAARPTAPALPPALRGHETVAIPLRPATWRLLLLAVPAALLCLWFGLTLGRAVKHDPARAVRRATRRSLALLAEMEADPAARRPLLRRWQQEAARALRLDHAAPVPASFSDPRWRTLWAEAERALYAPTPDLPADWLARAEDLCREIVPPRREFWRLRARPPASALLALALLVPAAPVLPARTAAAPDDWIAHYNHALALARTGRWEEAAAQSLVAWAQNPRAPETRALARLAVDRAGIAGTAPRAATSGDWLGQLAGLMSPAGWQWLVLAIAWVAGAATAALIVARFRGRRLSRALPFMIWAAALSLAVPGLIALAHYGPLADPDAAIVARPARLRPLPVEVPGDRSPVLHIGDVARPGRRFLDWRHVVVNDRAGWIREGALAHVWRDDAVP